jgi:hypothetical protein
MVALHRDPPAPIGGVSGACYHEIGKELAETIVSRVAPVAHLGILLDAVEHPDSSNWDSLDESAKDDLIDNAIREHWEDVHHALTDIPDFDAGELTGRVKIEAAQASGGVAVRQCERGTAGPTGQVGADIGGGMPWQEAAERLERLRAQGEAYTSRREYAKRFVCSSSTIQKAIRETPSLRPWASRKRKSAPRAQSLNEVVIDNTPQQHEPDPAGVMEQEDIDRALRYLIEQASPDEKARVLAMPPDQQRKLAKLAYEDPDRGDQILGRKP